MRTVSVLIETLTISISFQEICRQSVVKMNSCSDSALLEL